MLNEKREHDGTLYVFDKVITNTFFNLALSYVDKETCEEDILSFFKHENFSINSTFIVQNSEKP